MPGGAMQIPGMPPDPLDGMGFDGMMGGNPEEALAEWIFTQLERGPIDRFELRNTGANGEACVNDWSRDELADAEPQSIAATVYEAACADAESASRVQRYAVCCYRPGDAVYKSRFFLRVSPADLDRTFESEEPNQSGITSQLMRHTEGFARLTLGAMNSVVRGLQIQNAEKDKALREHTQLQLQTLKLQQAMLDQSAERDIRLAKARRNLELQSQVIGKAMSYGEGWFTEKFPQLAAAGARAAPSTNVDLAPEEVSQLDRVCLAVVGDLAALDDAVWAMALGQLPPDARGPMRRARMVIQEAQAEGRHELTAEEGQIVQATRKHLIGLFLTLDDQQFAALLAQTSEESRDPLRKFRALVRARAAQATTPPATHAPRKEETHA
jgi:hypothetical protein